MTLEKKRGYYLCYFGSGDGIPSESFGSKSILVMVQAKDITSNLDTALEKG